MADAKISQLPVATSSAGTDVLPIVQSSTTKQLAIQNLVPQNLKSNATTGVLQVTGPAAGTTRVMTAPDANFTAARTDAAQSFTGDQTLATGNIIQGTAAKGLNFTANTPATGHTSQLLNWYEEGTWTPTLSTSNVDFTSVSYLTQSGNYIRIGGLVFIRGEILTSGVTIGSASGTVGIKGLPFAATKNSTISLSDTRLWATINPNEAYVGNDFIFLLYKTTSSGGSITMTVNLVDTGTTNNLVRFAGCYYVA